MFEEEMDEDAVVASDIGSVVAAFEAAAAAIRADREASSYTKSAALKGLAMALRAYLTPGDCLRRDCSIGEMGDWRRGLALARQLREESA